jgi:hypothetical protein
MWIRLCLRYILYAVSRISPLNPVLATCIAPLVYAISDHLWARSVHSCYLRAPFSLLPVSKAATILGARKLLQAFLVISRGHISFASPRESENDRCGAMLGLQEPA